MHGNGCWQLPGGKPHAGDANRAATALRELYEETGLFAESGTVIAQQVDDFPAVGKRYTTYFMGLTGVAGTPHNREPDKNAGWEWFDLDALPEPLFMIHPPTIAAIRAFAARSTGDWIAQARLAGRSVADLPAKLRPRTEAAGYRAHARLTEQLCAAGQGPVVGWKVGVTTPQMRAHLGLDAPIGGMVLAHGHHESGALLAAGDYVRLGIECEIAFVLGAPLAGPVTRAEAAAAVTAVHPAIELVDDRYGGDFARFGAPSIIADGSFHAGYVLGAPAPGWRDLDLAAVRGETRANGGVFATGKGADVLGHPLESLAWLANRLGSLGQRIDAGQIVLTGSLPLPYWAAAGDHVEIAIEGLGAVTATIA